MKVGVNTASRQGHEAGVQARRECSPRQQDQEEENKGTDTLSFNLSKKGMRKERRKTWKVRIRRKWEVRRRMRRRKRRRRRR
ncbi:hypothetical protein E2C01_030672 [Portunus trituberculatus]|uniref:Uncharacterized protein n=1 Tax=Portunus trituberculatus TaxID=210409 RepID=A0A5B7EVW9_PORTR|nr:hypothetical protein [Portunus trituberculatus]